MLNFGSSLLTQNDVNVIQAITKHCSQTFNYPLIGVEVGSWLGRSTLALLAPDLPIADPSPLEDIGYQMMTREFSDFNSVRAMAKSYLINDILKLSPDDLLAGFAKLFTYRVANKRQYFSKLYSIDTWGGIESELHIYFRETLSEDPHQIFLANIRKAGFEGVVETLRGTSWNSFQHVQEQVDLIFLDADHEYEAVVRDLFACRNSLREDSLLFGHDFANRDRWPGVELAVKNFVKYYGVQGNIWVAESQGIKHLQSLPPYEAFKMDIEKVQAEHNKRYQDPVYRAKYRI